MHQVEGIRRIRLGSLEPRIVTETFAEELALTGKRWHVYDIPRFFGEEFFETKKVVYTPR